MQDLRGIPVDLSTSARTFARLPSVLKEREYSPRIVPIITPFVVPKQEIIMKTNTSVPAKLPNTLENAILGSISPASRICSAFMVALME